MISPSLALKLAVYCALNAYSRSKLEIERELWALVVVRFRIEKNASNSGVFSFAAFFRTMCFDNGQ